MNKKLLLIGGGIVVVALIGIFVFRSQNAAQTKTPAAEEETTETTMYEPVDASVVVTLEKSVSKANSVLLVAKGLSGKYKSVGYEFSYESKGLIKGVNSGSKPLDISGKDTFEKEVYLGTCSKNDCTPDVGVTTVSIVLDFTDANGKRSQFSKDFEI